MRLARERWVGWAEPKPASEKSGTRMEPPCLDDLRIQEHAIQTERWRYIRYSDGGEELYDHSKDPNEWTNLARNPEFAAMIKRVSVHLPKMNE